MHFKIIFPIVVLAVLIISCKKETFPDNEDLKGRWVEISFLLDRQELVFGNEDTLFYTRPASRYISADTFLNRLDKRQERLFLTSIAFSDSQGSSYKIQLDKKANELTVWGLLFSIPESPSVSKFKKQ
jgi:hypothetical protein